MHQEGQQKASYKRVTKEVIAYPVDDVLPDRKKWNVIAVEDVYDSTGKMSSEEMYYWVSVAIGRMKCGSHRL